MEDIKLLLEEWGLASYFSTFEANRITLPTLAMLDSEMVKELISPIGDRARFLKNLENWKNITRGDILEEDASSYTINLDDDSFVDVLNPSHRKVLSISEFLLPKVSNTGQGSSNQEKENTSEVVMINDNTRQEDNTAGVIIIDHADQNQSTSDLTNSSQMIIEENEAPSCSVPLKNLLMNSNEGQGLLNLYLEEGKLTSNGRRKLCNIIIKNLMESNAEKKIDSSILLERAQQITEVFKKENISTYFIPYINDSKLKIKRCAKGKLYDCLQNRRRELREAKVIKKKSNNDNSDTVNACDEQLEAALSDNCNEEDIQWLQNCIEPWHTLEEKWRRTAKFRINEINSGNMSIIGYMTKYPALKTTRGHELLIADFDHMYPSSANKFNQTFEGVKPKLFKMALSKCHIAEVKEILEQYQLLKKDDENYEEAESILALMLLPLLLGNPSHKVKKQVWRPSKAEVKDGFITYVTRAMDLKDTMEKRREKYLKLNLTFQPTVVIVGPNYMNIEKYYVNVNETYFEMQTIIKCVETCFKIYHALHCQYPVESTCVWTFVQIGLYQLKTKWDKQYSTVNAFITDLGIEVN